VSGFDWQAVRERLEELGRAIESGGTRSAVEVEAILRQRAEALARQPEPAETGDLLEILLFSRRGQKYGIDLLRVVEALPVTIPTPLPGKRFGLAGVVSHRAGILAVVDLAGLGRRGGGEGAPGRIVVAEAAGTRLGLLADEILGLARVALSERASDAPGTEPWVTGVTSDLVRVVDLAALIQDPQVNVNE
jgi:purine-binding chemotaxis protein CheW